MVNRIITNKIYIGTLEQGKTSKLNYKSSRIINLNKEDWIVKEDAHDKIVSKSIFLLANKMLLRDIRNLGVPDLLSGMLFCYECNSSLSKRTVKNKNGRENITYSCSNHKKNKTCSSHTISEEKILKAIVFVMNNYSKKYNELIKKLSEINISDFNIEIHTEFLQKEKKKFEHLRHSLYFDLEDELISKKEFENYRQYYLNKIRDIDNKIANKHSLYQKLKENFNTGNFKKFIQKVNEENLDRFTLVSFVDKVLIKENGEIEVVLNNYDTLDILEKLATSIENKTKINYNKKDLLHMIEKLESEKQIAYEKYKLKKITVDVFIQLKIEKNKEIENINQRLNILNKNNNMNININEHNILTRELIENYFDSVYVFNNKITEVKWKC